MKAITVRPPWARCIAVGAKTIENRGRNVTYRGEIAIHAGKSADMAGDRDPRVIRQLGQDPRVGAAVGAVVAVADLVDCHEAQQVTLGACCGPWGDRTYNGQPAFHLVLDNIVMLSRPVYCRGALQVPWTLPGHIEEQVRGRIAEEAEWLRLSEEPNR